MKTNKNKKNTNKKNNDKLNLSRKQIYIVAAIFVALVGSLALGGTFAQAENNDYRLKSGVEQTTLSLTNEKPTTASRDASGKVSYSSRGKSIDVTVTGKIYCTPEDSGQVKVANISQEQLQSALSQIRNNQATQSKTEVDGAKANIGNSKGIMVSGNSTGGPTNITSDNAATEVNSVEAELDKICKNATQIVPADQVPAFVPNTVNIKDVKKPKKRNILRSSLVPSADAYAYTNSAEPEITPAVEEDQVARINYERAIRGIPQMGKSDCLTRAARSWARVMAISNYLRHSEYVGLVDAECGPNWWSKLGENVGYAPQATLESYNVFQAYMNSPGHRANILDPSFQRVGVGANHYSYPSKGYALSWTSQLFARCIGSCVNK